MTKADTMSPDYLFLTVVAIVGIGGGWYLLGLAKRQQKGRDDFSQGERGAVIHTTGKSRVTMYLDNELIASLRAKAEAKGQGCESMINDILRISTGVEETRNITPAGGNVFVDLGFPPDEATALQAESKRVIAEKLFAKSAAQRKEVK